MKANKAKVIAQCPLAGMLRFVLAAASVAAVTSEWVFPRNLPVGHNGGFKEKLVTPASPNKKPHIVMLLFDDYGTGKTHHPDALMRPSVGHSCAEGLRMPDILERTLACPA